jgi:hypothetical protein
VFFGVVLLVSLVTAAAVLARAGVALIDDCRFHVRTLMIAVAVVAVGCALSEFPLLVELVFQVGMFVIVVGGTALLAIEIINKHRRTPYRSDRDSDTAR